MRAILQHALTRLQHVQHFLQLLACFVEENCPAGTLGMQCTHSVYCASLELGAPLPRACLAYRAETPSLKHSVVNRHGAATKAGRVAPSGPRRVRVCNHRSPGPARDRRLSCGSACLAMIQCLVQHNHMFTMLHGNKFTGHFWRCSPAVVDTCMHLT